jgi:hypothetical protein
MLAKWGLKEVATPLLMHVVHVSGCATCGRISGWSAWAAWDGWAEAWAALSGVEATVSVTGIFDVFVQLCGLQKVVKRRGKRAHLFVSKGRTNPCGDADFLTPPWSALGSCRTAAAEQLQSDLSVKKCQKNKIRN